MDTEGIGSLDADADHDAKIFAMVRCRAPVVAVSVLYACLGVYCPKMFDGRHRARVKSGLCDGWIRLFGDADAEAEMLRLKRPFDDCIIHKP